MVLESSTIIVLKKVLNKFIELLNSIKFIANDLSLVSNSLIYS